MVELPNEVLRENPIMYFILPESAEQGQKSAYSLEQDTMRFTLCDMERRQPSVGYNINAVLSLLFHIFVSIYTYTYVVMCELQVLILVLPKSI